MVDKLNQAKKNKMDEFYTPYYHIETEIMKYLEFQPHLFKNKTVFLPCDDPEWSNFTKFFAQNFETFGLKKLISTSYAYNSKNVKPKIQLSLFEKDEDPKSRNNGKIFTLDKDISGDGKIDLDDLNWSYLEGDGDFRSDEISEICKQVDFIITNPPFSLFREFVSWIFQHNKSFIVIGSMDAITYTDIFPLVRDDKMWLGAGDNTGQAVLFEIPENATDFHEEKDGKKFAKVVKTMWFTNVDHGRRYKPMRELMTEQDVIKFQTGEPFVKYDNYNAIEVSKIKHIPSDYDGIMGVPVSFLSQHCKDQFEIVGSNRGVNQDPNGVYGKSSYIDGKEVFKRLFIRHKK